MRIFWFAINRVLLSKELDCATRRLLTASHCSLEPSGPHLTWRDPDLKNAKRARSGSLGANPAAQWRGGGIDPKLRRMRWPSTACELEALPAPHFAVSQSKIIRLASELRSITVNLDLVKGGEIDATRPPCPRRDPTHRVGSTTEVVPAASCRDNGTYLMTLATTPAPTVRPPSRIAKRRPSSIAIGWIRLTTIFTLSPGITISTPSGSWQAPVTSVVRK